MRTFIEQYLNNSSAAITFADKSGDWMDSVDEDMIYSQLATPEFRLYEEIVFCGAAENAPGAKKYNYAA